jgi:plasmid stabilization system protein ParE
LTGDLRLDEYGQERLREWLLHTENTAEQRQFIRRVLDGVANRADLASLGMLRRDDATGHAAITALDDRTITVVVILWADEEETFSLAYVGDLADLESD